MLCYQCCKVIDVQNHLGFREECPYCGYSSHVCKNCEFYSVSVYNECKETSAERVVDKEKANYCEFFKANSSSSSSQKRTDPSEDAKRKLAELFGPKSK